MNYRTKTILRRGLPIVFWLLAAGGVIGIPLVFGLDVPVNYWWGFAAAALVMVVVRVLYRIDRHESSAEENFQMAVLLGVASYWVPTVLFLTLPCWGYMIYQNAFNLRSILATIIGYGLVALHAALCIWQGWIDFVWAQFFCVDYLWGWIPVGTVITAWAATTIVRQSLRER